MSGMRVVFGDGTVVDVPIEIEVADPDLREKYIQARYIECRGPVTFKQTMPAAADEEDGA